MFLRRSIFSLSLCVLVACTGGGSKELDSIFGNSGGVGDSAFTSSPSSVDFGNLALNSSLNRSFVVKNSSQSEVFVSSLTINNPVYSVISDSCPRSPSVMRPQESCEINIQFRPQLGGRYGAALAVRYGVVGSGDAQYVTNFGVNGVGVSPLVFAGLTSVGPQTHTSMTLNWAANTDATSFIVFRISGTSTIFEKIVLNTGGNLSQDVVTGLTPSTSYTWRVNGVDVLGSRETNTVDMTLSTNANRPPLLAAITTQTLYQGAPWSVNAQDFNSGNDTDIDGDLLTYTCFYDQTVDGSVTNSQPCTTLLNQDGSVATLSASTGVLNWTPPFSVPASSNYEFRITATDVFSGSHARIFVGTVNSGLPIPTYSPAGPFTFPGQFISASSPLTFDFTNTRTGSDLGVDSYACAFDQVIDGAMVASANCNTLPGTFSFNATTGVLNWTPLSTTWGPYEFAITATSGAGSVSEIIKVNVRSGVTSSSLVSYLDASFADGEKFASNSPLLTAWKDLANASIAYDGALVQADGSPTSGWNISVPRLSLDGVDDRVDFGNFMSALTNFSFDVWVQPRNLNNSVILGNGDSSHRGLTLKQSSYDGGKLVLVAGTRTFVDEILADSPDGYWRFNEPIGDVAYDLSGNRRHATYTTSVTKSQTGSIGDGDKSVRLDGSTGSILAPVAITGTVTIEVWASTTNLGTSPMLWRTGPSGSGPDLFFSSNISLNTWDSSSNGFCNIPASVTDGSFHQFVTVIDAAGPTATLYYDGALCGTATYKNPTAPSISFSSGLGPGQYEWLGNVEEAAVYSTALSASRVAAHYAARSRATCRATSPLLANEWSHVFGSYNDVGRSLNLWLNGKNQCTSSQTASITSSAQNLKLGQSTSNASPWAGNVGEIRTYSSSVNSPAVTNFSAGALKYSEQVPMAGVKLWLKADSLGHLNDGDPVAFWPDQSGLGNTAVQANAPERPSYYATGLNSKPAVLYNGNQCLTTIAADILGDHTIFIVFKDDGVAQSYERILDKDYAAGLWVGRENATASTFISGVLDPNPPYGVTNTYADSSANILTSRRLGTSRTLFANGGSPVTGAVAAGNTSSTVYGIGCWFNGNGLQRFGGMISEVIIYDSALSTTDRVRVEKYLGSKYSITVP